MMKILNDIYTGAVRCITAETEGTCSYAIELKLVGDEILDVTYYGGCSGNHKGIAALCRGQKIDYVRKTLKGITCGSKKTSCPDQLAQLIKMISE